MVALTSPAPAFSLPDLTGRINKLEAYRGQLVLLYFWSAVCPWSERADREIAKWPSSLASAAVILRLAMNADEGTDLVRGEAAKRFQGIVLLDSDRNVTDAYGAQLTPEFFLLDPGGRMRYHGALDDATFRRPAPTRPYLENALRALLAGGKPDPADTPLYGCAIVRWKI
ncbi:MAG TPA: redoxin domain-containing protein [Anaerolineales bacterium]